MTEQPERKKFFNDWEKYAIAMYVVPQLSQGQYVDSTRDASRVHLVGKGIDDLADTLAENPEANLGQILNADAQQYQKFFGELTVNEALGHIGSFIRHNGNFASEITRYGSRTIKELSESAKKYQDAMKKYSEAKTLDESRTAFEEMQLYKGETEALKRIGRYDMLKTKSFAYRKMAEAAPEDAKRIIEKDSISWNN